MGADEFKKLRYGNVIERDGQFFMVKQVIRDKEGQAKYVGLAEAIDVNEAEQFDIVSKAYISGPTIHEVE